MGDRYNWFTQEALAGNEVRVFIKLHRRRSKTLCKNHFKKPSSKLGFSLGVSVQKPVAF
jgi:hypothetical protein